MERDHLHQMQGVLGWIVGVKVESVPVYGSLSYRIAGVVQGVDFFDLVQKRIPFVYGKAWVAGVRWEDLGNHSHPMWVEVWES